ncbi:MAG: hypothetical protein JWO38_1869 [Gemmataceae bacterium]|nr:hypothetical protein [Gemmataceae bacterium]
MGRVKGQLVENGQPKAFPAYQAFVQLTPVGAEGHLDVARSFTAVVNEDGSFEVIASGGELPAGMYQVAVQARGKLGVQLKAFAPPQSPVRREIKPGSNLLTIDLAKSEG